MEEIKTGVFKIKNNKSIYVIGDIHGDYQCLIHCLVDLCKVAKITSVEKDHIFNEDGREYIDWKNNNDSIIIFCGDLIHRKRFQNTVLDDECSDIFIIETILRLKKKAKKNNGDIIIISGNHEMMNIINPSDNMYTSDKNIKFNLKYFSDKLFINRYIENSYAWVKIDDILIAHGGLCSDYLKFLDNEKVFNKNLFGGSFSKVGNDVVDFINKKYRYFFTDFDKNNLKKDHIGFKLFIEYSLTKKHTHNIFWCREWGYTGINCDNFSKLINKVDCNKMIIAHCPQFLDDDKPKMINFECVDDETLENLDISTKFKIARIDLGMSRAFEYNNPDNFFKFFKYNYHRKISVLKLLFDEKINKYYFNYKSVITHKLSCLQYLLIKYGIYKKNWIEKKIISNWLGFEYITKFFNYLNNVYKNKKLQTDIISNNTELDICFNQSEPNYIILCFLYQVINFKYNLKSVNQFNKLIKI
jgi:hypothetical protein